jgi:hypothetical protein
MTTNLESILVKENKKQFDQMHFNSFKYSTKSPKNTNFDFDKLESKKIVHLNTIKKTCIDYRLRFLDIHYFKGDIPTEAIEKIKQLELDHDIN